MAAVAEQMAIEAWYIFSDWRPGFNSEKDKLILPDKTSLWIKDSNETMLRKTLDSVETGIKEELVLDNGKFWNVTKNCPPEANAVEGETDIVVSGAYDNTDPQTMLS